MDKDDGAELIRRCFKCDASVLCNLNIAYTASNSTITLWNKFQIYVYESLQLNSVSKVIVPEFQIQDLIASCNYLVCVDNRGNVHVTPLKFKNTGTQKRFKGSFQLRELGVITCTLYQEDFAVSLKYESNTYYLNFHIINSDFQIKKSTKIKYDEYLPFQNRAHKCILKTCPISVTHIERLKTIFSMKDLHFEDNYILVILSFDKLNVYSCLFSDKMMINEVLLVKLYTCPSQICDININVTDNINIIIGLEMGTIVNLKLKEDYPKIIHLNAAIHKFFTFNDNLLYTDGLSMWIAENFISQDIKISQLFVKNISDFIKFGDNVICTTFTNLIYKFSLDDEKTYVKALSINDYCPVDKLFESSQYLDSILAQVKSIDTLIKIQKQERDYIMALSISNRQDIMDKIINPKVIVYASYKDAIEENAGVILTNNTSEYFDTDLFYFLIKINIMNENRLRDILSSSIGDLRIHVTLISKNKSVKTNTIKITNVLKDDSFLIPLKVRFINSSKMRVDIKVMTSIPGAYDAKQKMFAVLYRKSVIRNSEHFIKYNFDFEQINCLKQPSITLEAQILGIAMNQYGSIVKIINSKQSPERKFWKFYLRLPTDYQNALKNKNTIPAISSKKVQNILQLLTSEDFLKSKSSKHLTICEDKVELEMHNDGFTNLCLKISCQNVEVALDIRNFFSNLIYGALTNFSPGKEFVSHSFYFTVENLQKAIRHYVNDSSDVDIMHLIEQFERKIIGALPI